MVKIINQKITDNYSLYNGDCVEVIKGIPENSIGFSIFSPPFSNLYTYSNSNRDMGNCKNDKEFSIHFSFLIAELYRVMLPGRSIAIHCSNIPAMKERDGYIGLKDFRGDMIRAFQKENFIFHSEICIWKDPLIEAVRTKSKGLMYKQVKKDSSCIRQGIPDHLVIMRKPGENPNPIKHPEGSIFNYRYIGEDSPKETIKGEKYSHEIWRKYASPVWMDIRQTRTLNYRGGRGEKDEKHICPLQLDVIERAMFLWSKEDDIVLTPFAGIASEMYVAIQMKRKAIGIELKESYYRQGLKNLRSVRTKMKRSLHIQ